ncbi:MAG: class I SAM-dependent methyltransferase [Deltaproteobacteria bacterium]|nr:class I SAM-dependent methyltransferase [Deltaproteobacteria bacterium]
MDIGCGDGRVLRAAARRYGVKAQGIPLSPLFCHGVSDGT